MALQRDLVRRKPRRRTWTFAIAVPRDLHGVVVGKRGQPVKTVEHQLEATSHVDAIREAAKVRAQVLNEWSVIRHRRAQTAARFGAGVATQEEGREHIDFIIGHLTGPEAFEPRIRDHIDAYKQSRADLPDKSRQQIGKSLSLLLAFLGEHATVSKFTRPAITAWSDSMAATMAPATVNSHLSRASMFWRYLRKRSMVAGESPFVDQKRAGEGKRNRFTIDELTKLLASPSAIRWHIVAALFSGLRLSELVKARVEHGALFVAEEDGDGKTVSAERIIPLHSELIRLGFESKWPKHNTMPADTVSEKFTKHRQALGIGAPAGKRSDKTFHSLRHNFARALRNAGTPKTLHDALMGHKEGALYTLYAGAEGPAFELMRATIEKVAYPGLKL